MLPTNELLLSPYISLYDVLIPKDNVLRQINSLVDFSFVEDQLKKNYCLNNGRTAVSPIKMFKYLFLKVFYDLSDRDLVERAKFDLSFKFFLDLAPESDVIDASSLTKFRKLRIKDINILDLLIKKTVDIANENGLIKSKKLIVDSTHSCSRFNYTSPINLLTEKSKKLRKSIYKLDESYKKIMPQKPTTDNLQEHIDYCNTLIKVVKQEIGIQRDEIKNSLNLLEEIVNDNLELIESINDVDAKTGHKSIDTSFLGYKTHVGMSDERLITSAIVTSGEKPDGKQTQQLIENSIKNGMDVKVLIGDMAYSEQDNIDYCKQNNIKLVSKLNTTITNLIKSNSEFYYNKDAGMFVCKAGHMATRKSKNKSKEIGNVVVDETYFFNVNKCQVCPYKENCYKEGSKTKSYHHRVFESNFHEEHLKYQESEDFKSLSKSRYKIEAKNAELKNRHGYDKCSYSNLTGMQLQSAMSIFVVNIKRIITLKNEIK